MAPAVFNCFPPEMKPIRRPENVRIQVAGAFPVNVCPVIRRGLEEGQGRLAKNTRPSRGGFEADDTGGVLSGLLAEEDELDRRALWRIGSWGVGAIGAVILAVMANQSSLGLKRDQVAAADLTRQAQQIQSVARETQNEARRLAAAIDTLNSDRDRLYSRVTGLEQGLDSVTGAIARQGSAAASPRCCACGTAGRPKPRSQRPAVAPVATAPASGARRGQIHCRHRRARPGGGFVRAQRMPRRPTPPKPRSPSRKRQRLRPPRRSCQGADCQSPTRKGGCAKADTAKPEPAKPSPATPLMAAQSMMAPPDPAAGKTDRAGQAAKPGDREPDP